MGEATRSGQQGSDTPVRDKILDHAAALFAGYGYDATSVRDIAAAVGISAPALYHHFRSKEDIFCATHARGMETIMRAVKAAIVECPEPWDRLEAAAAAHCSALLSSSGYRTIITPQFPRISREARLKLIAERDSYEKLIKRMIADLDLPDSIDPDMFRMHLLGALNWATAWYRDDGPMAPAEIGRSVVRLLRLAVERDRGGRNADNRTRETGK